MNLDRSTLRTPWKNRSDSGSTVISHFLEQSGLGDLAVHLSGAGLSGDAVLKSLQAETQTEIFFQELFALGCELERRNSAAAAGKIFNALQSADPDRYPIRLRCTISATTCSTAMR